MEGVWTWFLPAIRQAQDWFETGEIGRLCHIRSDFGYPLRPYAAGCKPHVSGAHSGDQGALRSTHELFLLELIIVTE